MQKFEFLVLDNESSLRIDKFLSEKFSAIKPEITRSKIQNFMLDGLISLDETVIKNPSQKIKSGQVIVVFIKETPAHKLEAKEIAYEIIYEDDDLIVINKPAGLTVHPGAGNQEDTLVNALLFTHQGKLSSVNGEFRPGIVHRLDKDTSGLMLVAKNDYAHFYLSKNLQERKIKRSYLAFVYGVLQPEQGVINKNIARSKINRLKMTISKFFGRQAITHYQTKNIFFDGFASLVECNLETGRTHQIRVHMESMKHSLIGDQIYNSCAKMASKEMDENIKNFIKNFPRQALHSYKISFARPSDEKEMSFEIKLPDDLEGLYNMLNS